MNIKKWWALAWDNYYPQDALGNVRGTFFTYEEAEEYLNAYKQKVEYGDYSGYDHYEIINVESYLGLTINPPEFYIRDY